jgi:uncharacterized protein
VNGYYLRLALAWLAAVCVGCTSAPVRYYTLTAPPGNASAAPQTGIAVDVRALHTPRQLNHTGLMVRTGPTEVTLLENERWASPVNDEIKDALRLQLQRRLGPVAGLRPTFTTLTLDIDVQRFEAELGRYAVIEASWTATLSTLGQPPNGARATTCGFRAEEKIEAGYAGMVEGYQREIGALADAVVAVLASTAAGIGAPCR